MKRVDHFPREDGQYNDNSSPSDFEEISVVTENTANANDVDGVKRMPESELADKESQGVKKLRYLVFLALFLAAIVVSFIVYLITSSSQQREFEAQYAGMANELVKTFQDIATRKLSVLGSLRVTLMSHVLDMEKSANNGNGLALIAWPFVTFPSFQQRAASVRKLSKSLYIGLYPVIYERDRSKWESYSASNKNIWLYVNFICSGILISVLLLIISFLLPSFRLLQQRIITVSRTSKLYSVRSKQRKHR
jgi:hypothetical protein